MDISYWTKLNPDIKYEPTSKQFYNKYLARIVIDCPAGRLINSNHKNSSNLKYALQNRIQWAKNYNRGGSWGSYNKSRENLDDAKIDQIENLQKIKLEYHDRIKMRVEEPFVQIYAADETVMRELVSKLLPLYNDRITTIQIPEDDEKAKILLDGHIIVKKTTKIQYKYKVYLKDGNYSVETKKSLFNYLENLGEDNVKLNGASYGKFMGNHGYLWGVFLYVNDPSVLTFLSVIQPGIVSKIHELSKIGE